MYLWKKIGVNENNRRMLSQLHPFLRPKVVAILAGLTEAGYDPMIEEAWRSEERQAMLYALGQEHTTWSFHCARRGDKPEALAVNIKNSGQCETPFYLLLGSLARREHLQWGGLLTLTTRQKEIVCTAISRREWDTPVRLGSDPHHVEVRGVTLDEARRGVCPSWLDGNVIK